MKNICATLIIFLLQVPVFSQDSLRVFSLETTLFMVRNFHPVASQAQNLTEQADANLLAAKGQFDPKISYEKSNKFYSSKNYYDLGNLSLTVPAWPGVDFYVGTQTASGQYLNPDETTPPGGLSAAGISVPLLRNLITDQRRNLVRKAKLMQGQNEAYRKQQLNELCAEVILDYADWFVSWKETSLYRNAVSLAKSRLQAIRQEVAAGSKAEVDTLETWTQLQNFLISLAESETKLLKARLALSVHLWSAAGEPVEPAPDSYPGATGWDLLDSLGTQYGQSLAALVSADKNPWLQSSRLDIEMAKLDVKLKKQALLPELNLKYRMLGNGAFYQQVNYRTDDYQFGLKFSTSLFLRKERGDYQQAMIKMQNSQYKYAFKQREIENKNMALWQQRSRYAGIFEDYGKVVNGYALLYTTELQRMEAGESNMFMVNTRELRLMESRLKQIQYQRKMIETNIDFLQNAVVLYPLIAP